MERTTRASAKCLVGLALAAFLAVPGCGSSEGPAPVDPFDCQVISPSGFPAEGIPLEGDVLVEFTDRQFGHGRAPTRMKGMVTEVASNWFHVAACARDTGNRAWQLSASWMYLPSQGSLPLEFSAYPGNGGGEAPQIPLGDPIPRFGATLELCGASCVGQDWLAFDGPYFPNSNIQGTARVDGYDFCAGEFAGSAELAYVDQARKAQGPMQLIVNGAWVPTAEVSDGNVDPQTGQTGKISCPTGDAGAGDGAAGTTDT